MSINPVPAAILAIFQRESATVNAATYAAYYRQHMAGEEADLFPRVVGVPGVEDWKAVDDAIAAEADPLFGGNVGQRFRQRQRQIMLAVEADVPNA